MADPIQQQVSVGSLILGNIFFGVLTSLGLAIPFFISIALLHFFPIVFGVIFAAAMALNIISLLRNVKKIWQDPIGQLQFPVFMIFNALITALGGLMLYKLSAIAGVVLTSALANSLVSVGFTLMVVGAPAMIIIPLAVVALSLIYHKLSGKNYPPAPGSASEPSISVSFVPSAATRPDLASKPSISADFVDAEFSFDPEFDSPSMPARQPLASLAEQQAEAQALQQQLLSTLPADVSASPLTAEEMANPQVQNMMQDLEQQIVDSLPSGARLAGPIRFTAVHLQPGQQAPQFSAGTDAATFKVEELDSETDEPQAKSRLVAGRGR